MLNHVRTLLLNRAGATVGPEDFAHEHVPPDYRVMPLPTQLLWIRHVLFGATPDSAGLNYRLAQFMPMLHSPDLDASTRLRDSRVNYLPQRSLFPVTHTLGVVAQQPMTTSFVVPPDALRTRSGQLWLEWLIRVNDALLAPTNVTNAIVEVPLSWVTKGTAQLIGLPRLLNTSAKIESTALLNGDAFRVQVLREPSTALADLPARLYPVMTEETAGVLFGQSRTGYFGQFRQLWEDSDRLHERLAGVLLALAYRTEAYRLGKAAVI